MDAHEGQNTPPERGKGDAKRIDATNSALSGLRSPVSSHTGSSTLHAPVKLGAFSVAKDGSASFSVSPSSYVMLLLDMDCPGTGVPRAR